MRDLLSGLNNYALLRELAIFVRYGTLCQRFLWYQLALASCELYV